SRGAAGCRTCTLHAAPSARCIPPHAQTARMTPPPTGGTPPSGTTDPLRPAAVRRSAHLRTLAPCATGAVNKTGYDGKKREDDQASKISTAHAGAPDGIQEGALHVDKTGVLLVGALGVRVEHGPDRRAHPVVDLVVGRDRGKAVREPEARHAP